MNPNFIGRVEVYIYFGTKYDLLNIPLWTDKISQQATRMIKRSVQAVWQTTWLTSIRVNVNTYKDIVGAQFVKIVETGTGTPDPSTYWYNVMDYFQVSQKCAQLTLGYNPLLTLQVGWIRGITGVMRRWTVDDDTPFKWTYTAEPLNQAAPYNYSYATHQAAVSGSYIPLVGFPYNMEHVPDVKLYESDGSVEGANILYPVLDPLDNSTEFYSSVGAGATIKDGLKYYRWNTVTTDNVYANYNAAIGLGFDLTSNSYCVPASRLIGVSFSGTGVTKLEGHTETFTPGFGLIDSGYKNSKAGELGKYFTLYNVVSGDAVTVKNYEINDTSVTICVNPYSDGCFMARFASYLKDTSTHSGYVKSPTYPRLSIAGNTGMATMANQLNTTAERGSAYLEYLKTENQIATGRLNAENSYLGGLVGGASKMVAGGLMVGLGNMKGIAEMGGAFNQAVQNDVTYNNTLRSLETAQRNAAMTLSYQQSILAARGDIGQSVPAAFKLADSFVSNGSAYTFSVRQCTLAPSDRQRADRFFTAYGYNVDSNALNNVSQLQCRDRFTFIQADDVKITAVQSPINIALYRDSQTMAYIQDLFSAGLRIWKTEPDYDFTIANPIS